MTLLKFSPGAIARCRFAISPLAETVGSLIALHRPCVDPWLARWHERNQAAYRVWAASDEVITGMMAVIAATKWLPDTITPPPMGGVDTSPSAELAMVRSHSDEEVRADFGNAVSESWIEQDTRWLRHDDLSRRIADALDEGWRGFVQPDWSRRRSVLERDIMYRAGILAAYGWQKAVEGITRQSVWVGKDAIRFSDQDFPDRTIDDGLIFVPQTAGNGSWTCEQPPHYALVYPARGAAAPQHDLTDDAAASLLGAGRARVVRELTIAASSSQLAEILGVSLGTVSGHLAVLRKAGVVTGSRMGHQVVYRLTSRGTALLDAFTEPTR